MLNRLNNNAKPQPGAAALICLGLASLLTIGVSLVIFFNLDYFTTPKFIVNDNDVPLAGMQVWQIEKLLLWLATASLVCALILLIYKKIWHEPSTMTSLIVWLVITVLALAFSPKWLDFQIRSYDGPENITRYQLGAATFPLFAYETNTDTSTWYTSDYSGQEVYLCISEKRWKIFRLVIAKGFYPILNHENSRQLLRNKCDRIS